MSKKFKRYILEHGVKSKVNGLGSKWTVQTTETGRSCIKLNSPKVDGYKTKDWSIKWDGTGRSKEMKLNGHPE